MNRVLMIGAAVSATAMLCRPASASLADESQLVSDLRQAIADAPAGATVEIAAGTYEFHEPFVIAKQILLHGAGPDATVFDGGLRTNCFVFATGASGTVLSGVTVRNGRGARFVEASNGDGGGALFCDKLVTATVTNCQFVGCRTVANFEKPGSATIGEGRGSAVYSAGSLTVVDTVVADNLLEIGTTSSGCTVRLLGGGLYMNGGQVLNCLVANNVVLSRYGNNEMQAGYGVLCGGGLYGNSVVVSNCVFSGNVATNSAAMLSDYSGGGAYVNGSNAIVSRCRFTGNISSSGCGLYWAASSGRVTDSSFVENVSLATVGKGSGAFFAKGPTEASGLQFWENIASLGGYRELGFGAQGAVLERSAIHATDHDTNRDLINMTGGIGITNRLVYVNAAANYYFKMKNNDNASLFDRCEFYACTNTSSSSGFFRFGDGVNTSDPARSFEFRGCQWRKCKQPRMFFLGSSGFAGTACTKFRMDACTFADCTFTSDFINPSGMSKIDGVAAQELMEFRNTLFTGTGFRPFQSKWGSEYASRIHHCATESTDTVMAEEATNKTGVNNALSENASGALLPKANVLKGAGVASDWMTDATTIGGGLDVTWDAYPIEVRGTTYRVGCIVQPKLRNARIVDGAVDIGATSHAGGGLAVFVR